MQADQSPLRLYEVANPRLASQDRLHQLLELTEDGRLTWKHRDRSDFTNGASYRSFCNRHAGKEAFISINPQGYRVGVIDGVRVTGHRVVFKMVHGYEPEQVDHIDGNRCNNHPSNLRASNQSMNSRNVKLRTDNTSGYPGVGKRNDSRRKTRLWFAKISDGQRRNRHIGYFDTFEEAVAARKKAEIDLGYTERHGTTVSVFDLDVDEALCRVRRLIPIELSACVVAEQMHGPKRIGLRLGEIVFWIGSGRSWNEVVADVGRRSTSAVLLPPRVF